ncbi:Protein MUM2 [Spathaspora sp. JA1]|nr:Protein MUM2 [Spathaspora sp. JA1]
MDNSFVNSLNQINLSMDTSMSSNSKDSSTLTANTSFLSDNSFLGSNVGGGGTDYSGNPSTKFWSSTPTTANFNNLSFTNYSVQPQSQNIQSPQPVQSVQQLQQVQQSQVQSYPKLQYTSSFRTDDQQPTHTSTSNSSLLTNASSMSTSTSNKYNKPMLNINAPSYVPEYANYNTNTSTNTGEKYKYYYNNNNNNTNNNTNNNLSKEFESSTNSIDLTEDYNKLKLELFLKNQIIKNLTEQLNNMNKLKNSIDQNSTTSSNTISNFKMPKNHYQLFQDLSKTLQEKSEELEETKSRLEAVLVSLAQTNSPSNIPSDYDVQELTHKLINKLSHLSNENENLLKMISFGNKTSLLIEIGLLRHEIEQLKNKDKEDTIKENN